MLKDGFPSWFIAVCILVPIIYNIIKYFKNDRKN